MTKINIPLPSTPYNVYLEEHLLDHFSSYLTTVDDMVIITDSGIPTAYVHTVKEQLNDPLVFTIPAGEESKSLANYQAIIEEIIAQNIPKSGTVIALGGGVVGDLSGFIASTYMRGISFIQIPTTLLSQIDSSVGGKVAVNSKLAKNAIGTFYQPKAVFIDPIVLNTLEENQLHSGLAEMIKYGLIKEPSIIDILEKDDWRSNLLELIETSIIVKRDIVLQDEFDQGMRHILNYGHTLGHAIEQHSNYQFLHGEGIAIGMACMARKTPFYQRLVAVLKQFDLPYTLPYPLKELVPYILKDKKVHDKFLHFVLVETLGQAIIKPIPIEKVQEYLEEII